MNSKFSMMKSIVVTAALVAGVSGIARADNSMNPFGGDSYAYFQMNKPVVNGASSSRQSGLSERELQALSSESPVWQLPNQSATSAFASTNAPSSVRQSYPNGLSERDYQALSSESPVWQYPIQSQTSALASTDGAVVANTTIK